MTRFVLMPTDWRRYFTYVNGRLVFIGTEQDRAKFGVLNFGTAAATDELIEKAATDKNNGAESPAFAVEHRFEDAGE